MVSIMTVSTTSSFLPNFRSRKKATAKAVSTPTATKKPSSPSPPKLSPHKKTPSPSKTPGKRGRPLGSGSKKSTRFEFQTFSMPERVNRNITHFIHRICSRHNDIFLLPVFYYVKRNYQLIIDLYFSLGAAAVAGLAARATASAAKMRSKKKPSGKKNSSTASSAASASGSAASSSSSASSDSSSDEKEEEVAKKKATPNNSSSKAPDASKAKAAAVSTVKAKEKAKEVKNAVKTSILMSTDSESGKVARPTTRKTRGSFENYLQHKVRFIFLFCNSFIVMYLKSCPGANVRKSRHVTGKNVSDSDSDMEVTLHGGRGAKGGTGVGNAATTPGAGSSVAKKKFSSVLFPPVRKEIAGLQPIEKRMCPMVGCDSSGHLGEFVKKAFSNTDTPLLRNL